MKKKAQDLSKSRKKLSFTTTRRSHDLRRSLLGRKSVGDVSQIDSVFSEQDSLSSSTSNDSCHINADSGVVDYRIADNPERLKNLPQDIQASEESILQAYQNERDARLSNESNISMLDISLDKRKIHEVFNCSVVLRRVDDIANRDSEKAVSRASTSVNEALSLGMPLYKPNTLRILQWERAAKELPEEIPKRKPNLFRRTPRERNHKSLDPELRKAPEDSDNTEVAAEQLDDSLNLSCGMPLGAESCNINGLLTNEPQMMKHLLKENRVSKGSDIVALAESSLEKAAKLVIKNDKPISSLNSNVSREDHRRQSVQDLVLSKNAPPDLSVSLDSSIPSPINAIVPLTHLSLAQNVAPLSPKESLATEMIRESFQKKLDNENLSGTRHESCSSTRNSDLHGADSFHSSATTLSLPSNVTGFDSLFTTTTQSTGVKKSKDTIESSLSSNDLPSTNVREVKQDGNNTWTEDPFPDRTFSSHEGTYEAEEDSTSSIDDGSEEGYGNEGEGSYLSENPNMSSIQFQLSDITSVNETPLYPRTLCPIPPAPQLHEIHESNYSDLKHHNNGPQNFRAVQPYFVKSKKINAALKAPSRKLTETEMETVRSGLKQWMDNIKKDALSVVKESHPASTSKASILQMPISTASKTVKRKVPDPLFGDYRPPKRVKPKPYVTDRMYKFLEKKLEDKFGLESRIKAEEFVLCLCNLVQKTITLKNKAKYHRLVFKLRDKMVKLGLIKTQFDYHLFIEDYLPMAFRVKAIPCYGCFKGPTLDVRDLHMDL
ncbi:LOW QUALITY PROTEIN: Centromere protein T [Frankliniella fusca]|uniref:Centromere protein T n=1 Tax=Frankliniella fusca TaxID=407009 RepID=A0AAE1HQQ5_9NEOP|nr:LOW QUALITY PROTEIN: Centromere protein T [Frankliniella fusca]